MTSLSAAFDVAPNATASLKELPYSNPTVPQYEDNVTDEADKRYAYERSRQKLYAKAPPHHNGQRPVMSSQESFKEMRPGEYGKNEPTHQKAPMSCSSCQEDMCCSGDNVFCVSCNRQTLAASGSSIPSLFQ